MSNSLKASDNLIKVVSIISGVCIIGLGVYSEYHGIISIFNF